MTARFVSGLEMPVKTQLEACERFKPSLMHRTEARIEWLASNGFYVTSKGTLDNRHKQAWPLPKQVSA